MTLSQTHHREGERQYFSKETSDRPSLRLAWLTWFLRIHLEKSHLILNGRMSVHAHSFQYNLACIVCDEMQTDGKSTEKVVCVR